MAGLARFVVMAAVGLTIVYVCLWFYARAGERERLVAKWVAEQPPLPQETFVKDGLQRYEPALRRRLIWGVYVFPISGLVALIYVLNFL